MWLVLFACTKQPAVPASRPPPIARVEDRVDPAARAFALRAWKAEQRGDFEEAERAWRWVERLDPGPRATLLRAEATARAGYDATALFAQVLAQEPDNARARFGLALQRKSPLDPQVDPCRLASADHPQRAEGEALCAR